MQARPLDALRMAHSSALGELEALEKSARLLTQDGGTGSAGSASGGLDKVFGFFDGELKVHFRHEEEILFPYLAQVIGREGPIAAMLEEHQTLWRTLEALQDKVSQWKAAPAESRVKLAPAVQQIANHIVAFLRAHIQKEDTVLFPLAEEALAPQAMKEVVDRIQAIHAPA